MESANPTIPSSNLAAPGERQRLFGAVASEFAAPLTRLARAYEMNSESRRDLLQDIHIALWNSLANFDGRCSLRTWVYRVAHNVGAKHIQKQLRARVSQQVSLDDTEPLHDERDGESELARQQALEAVLALIYRLKPLDRQLMLLYLEELDAATISDITGISVGNVATKIHRINQLLAAQFTKE